MSFYLFRVRFGIRLEKVSQHQGRRLQVWFRAGSMEARSFPPVSLLNSGENVITRPALRVTLALVPSTTLGPMVMESRATKSSFQFSMRSRRTSVAGAFRERQQKTNPF